MINSNDNLNSKISAAADISKPWDKDNQAWWDWYVSYITNGQNYNIRNYD